MCSRQRFMSAMAAATTDWEAHWQSQQSSRRVQRGADAGPKRWSKYDRRQWRLQHAILAAWQRPRDEDKDKDEGMMPLAMIVAGYAMDDYRRVVYELTTSDHGHGAV